jgi:protein-tyrosine-phosphatase
MNVNTRQSPWRAVQYRPLRVLFLCMRNDSWSVFAAAIARRNCTDVIAASSAGLAPVRRFPAELAEVLSEYGAESYEAGGRAVYQYDLNSFDVIVNFGPNPLPANEAMEINFTIPDDMRHSGADLRQIGQRVNAFVMQLSEHLRRARRINAA